MSQSDVRRYLLGPNGMDQRSPPEMEHRSVKYPNNRIEADHGKLKRLVKPTLGFKPLKMVFATLKRFEVMRMFRKGQFKAWMGEKNELLG